MMSCSNCLYFRLGARSAVKDGICRRHPPGEWTEEGSDNEATFESDEDGVPLMTLHAVVTYVGWPDVAAHDWCGEWSPPYDDDSVG